MRKFIHMTLCKYSKRCFVIENWIFIAIHQRERERERDFYHLWPCDNDTLLYDFVKYPYLNFVFLLFQLWFKEIFKLLLWKKYKDNMNEVLKAYIGDRGMIYQALIVNGLLWVNKYNSLVKQKLVGDMSNEIKWLIRFTMRLEYEIGQSKRKGQNRGTN